MRQWPETQYHCPIGSGGRTSELTARLTGRLVTCSTAASTPTTTANIIQFMVAGALSGGGYLYRAQGRAISLEPAHKPINST